MGTHAFQSASNGERLMDLPRFVVVLFAIEGIVWLLAAAFDWSFFIRLMQAIPPLAPFDRRTIRLFLAVGSVALTIVGSL